MENQSKDSYVAHITVTLVINIMLLTLILKSREFFTQKIRNWKDENDFPKLQNLFRRRHKVWPLVDENDENGQNGQNIA